MKISDFAFVGHPVSDLQRARRFYEEVLLLPPPKAVDGAIDSEQGHLEYAVGASTLAITTYWTGNRRPDPPSGGLVLEVEDFQEAIDHLKKHSVAFDLGPHEGPGCFIAVISDPDGNKIGIHKRK